MVIGKLISGFKNLFGIKEELKEKDFEQISSIVEPYFDEVYYLKNYPWVTKSETSPLHHYINLGWKDKLNPSSKFSTSFYLEQYPDVAKAKINPLIHYAKYGKKEGRKPTPNALIKKSKPKAKTISKPKPVTKLKPIPKVLSTKEKSTNKIKETIKEDFDADFYKSIYLDENYSNEEALIHYIESGWLKGHDPNSKFSTNYYLTVNPDIYNSGMNPFFHYIKYGQFEGRSAVGVMHHSNLQNFNPTISVIVPNFNHERFLENRLDTIINQSYQNFELIILDDCSSDNSVALIERYAKKYPEKIKTVINKKNSGNVFRQWRKGLEAASGELIWICESDDSTTSNFLEKTYPYFIDSSVMICFGKIQFIMDNDEFREGLDNFREGAEKGIWGETRIRSAKTWFDGPFGIRNIIPNVGGCIFRNQKITDAIWDETETYHVLGDWFLYATLSQGGKIVYEPSAVSYFRQHGKNTSVKSFLTQKYYQEHFWFMQSLIKKWSISEDVIQRFYKYTKFQFVHHFGKEKLDDFHAVFKLDELLNAKRTKKHVMIGFLGFHVGGGEIFPINLANELLNHGYIVSMLAINRRNEVKEIRDILDKRIPVYDTDFMKKVGVNNFFKNLEVDILNTHYIGLEYHVLLQKELTYNLNYIVTLHGSYEVSNLTDKNLLTILRKVKHWIYTADRNTSHLRGIPINPKALTKLPNAMALTEKTFEVSRQELGLTNDDFLFGFMARAIPSKGWEDAILAISKLAKKYSNVHLLMVGEGEEQKRTQTLFDNNPNVHFLGFQSNVHGFFKMCNCCLLPTKFKGESYPLVLIQSMQVGCPIITTDIGEIASMVITESGNSGIVIPLNEDQTIFVDNLVNAMETMLENEQLNKYAKNALEMGRAFSIEKVALSYKEIFDSHILTQKTTS